MTTVLLWVAAITLVAIGIAGSVLPVLPGAPLVLLGLVLAAWIDDFARVGWLTLAALALLTVLTLIVDAFAATLGAKRVGASPAALIGSTIGTVLGVFGGFVGVILGPFIGAVAGELFARPDLHRAGRVGLATWIGFALGIAAKLAILFAMIGIFAVAYWW